MTDLIRYYFEKPPLGAFSLLAADVKGKRYRKEIAQVGDYTHPSQPDGVLHFTRERLEAWVKTFFETKAADIDLAVPLNHGPDPTDNTGWVVGMGLEGDMLYADLVITRPDVAELLDNKTIRFTSIAVGPLADDKGHYWDDALIEVSLVTEPHIRKQEGFIRLSATHEPTGKDVEVPDNETMRLELQAAHKRITELEGDIKNSEEVKGLTVKLTAAEAEKATAVEERDALKTTVETLKEEQFKAKVETKVVELKAAKKLTPAEEKDLREALTLASENERAFELAHKPYSDRKPAPTSPSIHAGDNAPTGTLEAVREETITLAAAKAETAPEDFMTRHGKKAFHVAWGMTHNDYADFPEEEEGGDK